MKPVGPEENMEGKEQSQHGPSSHILDKTDLYQRKKTTLTSIFQRELKLKCIYRYIQVGYDLTLTFLDKLTTMLLLQ